MHRIAIIGATGVVGSELLSLLEKRAFPMAHLRCFASSRSVGKSISCQKKYWPIEELQEESFKEIDLAFFCAGARISTRFAPFARQSGAFVIDASSAFRMDPTVPLIIPEINSYLIDPSHRFVASPNCAATILLLPLAPLHRLYRVKRAIVATYQAASGGGYQLMQRLEQETKAALEGTLCPASLPYAFNLYPHNSPLSLEGYVEEEEKIRDETRLILEDPLIQLSATCIRVPILRAHSLCVNVEFYRPFCLENARNAIKTTPGVRLFEQREINRFATPWDATGVAEILCGRLRVDSSQPNTLEFWAVGDQLLKGAALNLLQIAEYAHTAQLIK